MERERTERQLSEAARRLRERGLVDAALGRVAGLQKDPNAIDCHSPNNQVRHEALLSARIPGQSSFATRSVSGEQPPETGGTSSDSPTNPPVKIFSFSSDEQGGDHGEIYHVRGDVGAVLTGQLPWMKALCRLGETLPAVFDEQVRQLGPGVQRLDLQGGSHTASDKRTIRKGNNAFLCADRVLCLGATVERLVLNVELLEKCAQAFVLASLTGRKVRRIPWFVRFEAFRRLRRDERRAAEAFARGKMPSGVTAY